MKIALHILLITLLSYTPLLAQQLSDFNLYKDSWMLLNPASFSENYLFNGSTHSLGLSGRYQWIGLEEPPTTIGVQYQAVLESQNIAIGGSLINDQTGAIGTTGLYTTFSYLMPLQKYRNKTTQFLSIGLTAGMVQYRVNFSEITFNEPGTTSIPLDNQMQYYPDFGLGVFYYVDNKFYAGLSMPQLLQLSTQSATRDGSFSIERQAHYYAMIGGYLALGDKRNPIYLEPSAWLRYVANAPISADANLRINFRNVLWVGGGYSLSHNLHLEMGYIFKNKFAGRDWLKIGFGYTYNANDFGIELGNTLELNLTYAWGESKRLFCPFE